MRQKSFKEELEARIKDCRSELEIRKHKNPKDRKKYGDFRYCPRCEIGYDVRNVRCPECMREAEILESVLTKKKGKAHYFIDDNIEKNNTISEKKDCVLCGSKDVVFQVGNKKRAIINGTDYTKTIETHYRKYNWLCKDCLEYSIDMTTETNKIRNWLKKEMREHNKDTPFYNGLDYALSLIPKDCVCVKKKDLLTQEEQNIIMGGIAYGVMPKDRIIADIQAKLEALTKKGAKG